MGKILKSYAELEASVKDENDGLDRAEDEEKDDEDEEEEDEGEDEEEEGENEGKDATKEDFWDFIKEFKHALNETDLKIVEKFFNRDSKIVEDDEGIEDGKMVIEKVDELKNDFDEPGSDCFKHCSKEKIHCQCL